MLLVLTVLETRYSVAPGVRAVFTPFGGVLLDKQLNRSFAFNWLGARILVENEHGLTLAATIDVLARECGVSVTKLRQDAEAFILKLVQLGLLFEMGHTAGV
jgi:hypothetical protein